MSNPEISPFLHAPSCSLSPSHVEENFELAWLAWERYRETFDLAALVRVKAYLDLAASQAGRLMELEETALSATLPPPSIRVPGRCHDRSRCRHGTGYCTASCCAELKKTRRRAFAVARDFGLRTTNAAAMRAALSRFLRQPVISRRDLTTRDWERIIRAIEQLELWW